MKKSLFIISTILLFTACNDTEETDTTPTDLGVYVDYQVSGDEELDKVTCLFHFFSGEAKRTSLLLEEPAKVALDGEELVPDSTLVTGAYYEIQKPKAGFKGKHTITFTNAEGKQLQQEFEFLPFTITNLPTQSVPKKAWKLKLSGLKDGSLVRVVVLDFSFEGEGINEVDTVQNGAITIPESSMKQLQSGPLILQLISENEKPVTKGFKKVGHISVSYSLKRELQLVD